MFGMNKMLTGVDKLVSMKFEVGSATKTRDAKAGHGGKKKQSKKSTRTKTQQISLKLPNMT